MQLSTIEMPKAEAQQAFLEYRRAVRERQNDEDAAIMRGYKALAKGQQIIDLRVTFRSAGQDEQGWPRLAIARADLKKIDLRRYNDGRLVFSPNLWNDRAPGRVTLPAGTIGVRDPSKTGSWESWDAQAMTPIIPPALRPKPHLRNYHLLWEAEWSKIPPKDPALLKHLGGTLYAVLATWDLTPVEQAVLGVTRN